jgi:hypothetical protein
LRSLSPGANGWVVRSAVSAGGLTTTTRLSARTYAGDKLAADLEPHGLHFNVPVALALSDKGCNVSDLCAAGMLHRCSRPADGRASVAAFQIASLYLAVRILG